MSRWLSNPIVGVFMSRLLGRSRWQEDDGPYNCGVGVDITLCDTSRMARLAFDFGNIKRKSCRQRIVRMREEWIARKGQNT